jgi:pimeloyl-ACP methyl ester carboxylesterase
MSPAAIAQAFGSSSSTQDEIQRAATVLAATLSVGLAFLSCIITALPAVAEPYGLGMTNPVTPSSNEACTILPRATLPTNNLYPKEATDLLPQSYQLTPASFLDNVGYDPSNFGYINLPASSGVLEPNGRVAPFLEWEAWVGTGGVAQGAAAEDQVSVPGEKGVTVPGTLVDAVMIQMGLMGPPTFTYPPGYKGANMDPSIGSGTLAAAVAQLAVSGRTAFNFFRQWHPNAAPAVRGPQDADLIQLVQQRVLNADPTALAAAVKVVLDTAYSTLWAIRGNDPTSRAQRSGLGWIAVSGEDDTPHRPVNVPTAPFPQFDLPVTVQNSDVLNGAIPNGSISITTRFMVASSQLFLGPDPAPPGFSFSPPPVADLLPLPIPLPRPLPIPTPLPANRQMPTDTPVIPANSKIIIYIHGGGSRAEEAVPLAEQLIVQGASNGQNYTVISFDLPSSAYGDAVDPAKVYGSSYNAINYPILNFEKAYVIQFIETLDQTLGNIKNRIVAVMGGSLGGNLSLMLASANDASHPYLKTIIAWSPTAMLATSGLSNLAADNSWVGILDGTHWGLEQPNTRQNYFQTIYFVPVSSLLGIPPDPEMWYRDGWTDANNLDCKGSFINRSRFDRYEIYSSQVRRWTTAIDLEQVLFDFRNADPNSNSRSPYYLTMSSRLLLAAGADDNYSNVSNPGGSAVGAVAGGLAGAFIVGTALGGPLGGGILTATGAIVGAVVGAGVPTLNNVDIFGYTHDVANLMINTPGRTLFINNTGHSIHDERPQFFAQEIVNFLTQPDTNLRIDLSTSTDDLRWNSQAIAYFFTPSNQALAVPLNQLWHPWNSAPPATDSPCGLVCDQVNYFQFPNNSTESFTIGLSRSGITVGEIQTFGIQFLSGQSVPTDTGDNWNMSGVVLTAVSGPAGTGVMVDASAFPTVKRFVSPSDVWNTTSITEPTLSLTAEIQSQLNIAWGETSSINVIALDQSGNAVAATVGINGAAGPTNTSISFKNNCTVDQVVVSGKGTPVVTTNKVPAPCRGTVSAPGFSTAGFTAEVILPPPSGK